MGTSYLIVPFGIVVHGTVSHCHWSNSLIRMWQVPPFYKFILGVTGTLREGRLPPEARDLLRDEILIEHMTYCPSMYGELKRSFDSKSKDDIQA